MLIMYLIVICSCMVPVIVFAFHLTITLQGAQRMPSVLVVIAIVLLSLHRMQIKDLMTMFLLVGFSGTVPTELWDLGLPCQEEH
jgi:hypothetical protein